MNLKPDDTIISEGYRFRVTVTSGRNFTAVDELSGTPRHGYMIGSHGSGTEIEWLDGDPNWHEKAMQEARRAAQYAPPPAESDPAELTRPDRFNRDPFDD